MPAGDPMGTCPFCGNTYYLAIGCNCPSSCYCSPESEPFMKTQGLMPRRPHGFPVSRDWADIDCKATGCMYNRNEKCMVPSRCKINTEGRCDGFEAPPPKEKIDGD
jgi:hypothetical protein